MAGTDSASERRRIQRQIARELKAGQYRPRARSLTKVARIAVSYGPLMERNIQALGIDGLPEEVKYRKGCEDAFRKIGLQRLQTRLNVQYSDTRYYINGDDVPGRTHWEARDDELNEMLYFYHGALWAFI